MADVYSSLMGSGSFLPQKILYNEDLAKMIDTSDDWIVQRTGIKKRHIISEGETTSSMAAHAACRALKAANVTREEVQAIIFATTTPDMTFPSCANILQADLECWNACAFDIQAVCCGFINALVIADLMIKSRKYDRILVIGSDSMSTLLDWNDRSTCILFGDGAGAVVMGSSERPGLIDFNLLSDGSFKDKLFTNGGVSTTQTSGVIKMQGKIIFQQAVYKMQKSIFALMKANKLCIEQIDKIIVHQANIRILETLAEKLNCSLEKIPITVDQHANTSAASVPLALDYQIAQGIIKKGDLLILAGVGAGLSWGSVVLRF